MNRKRFLAFALAVAACGGEPEGIARLEIDPPATMVNALGEAAQFQVVAYDSSGGVASARGVAWASADPDVAAVSGSGLATAAGSGIARIVAELAGVADTALFEVWIPPTVTTYAPGTSYFGRNGYVEYIPGTLPLVISAPHGGGLEPAEIPDRTYGTLVTDASTVETLHAVRDALLERTGAAPHIVISHLRRTKLDPNREIVEAAQGDPFAENAWEEFQGFIEVATERVARDFGEGLYLDLHGHGHDVDRVELGYLLSAAALNGDDAALDGGGHGAASSIAALAARSSRPFSQLLRGAGSFGGRLGEEGVPSVPSPDDPAPGQAPYFTGGYNTARHGSRSGGTVDGIQMELPRPGIRDSDGARNAFGKALAAAVEAFMLEHYGFFRPGTGA